MTSLTMLQLDQGFEAPYVGRDVGRHAAQPCFKALHTAMQDSNVFRHLVTRADRICRRATACSSSNPLREYLS